MLCQCVGQVEEEMSDGQCMEKKGNDFYMLGGGRGFQKMSSKKELAEKGRRRLKQAYDHKGHLYSTYTRCI